MVHLILSLTCRILGRLFAYCIGHSQKRLGYLFVEYFTRRDSNVDSILQVSLRNLSTFDKIDRSIWIPDIIAIFSTRYRAREYIETENISLNIRRKKKNMLLQDIPKKARELVEEGVQRRLSEKDV